MTAGSHEAGPLSSTPSPTKAWKFNQGSSSPCSNANCDIREGDSRPKSKSQQLLPCGHILCQACVDKMLSSTDMHKVICTHCAVSSAEVDVVSCLQQNSFHLFQEAFSPRRFTADIAHPRQNQRALEGILLEILWNMSTKEHTFHMSPLLPPSLIGSAIAPFLGCRTTFNNLAMANKEIRQICSIMQPPWPQLSMTIPNQEEGAMNEGDVTSCRSILFSPQDHGKTLACACGDGLIRLFEVCTGSHHVLRGHKQGEEISSIAYSSDGKYLASASNDATIRIWDTKMEECIVTLEGHRDNVRCVAFAPHDGFGTLASGSVDEMVRIWQQEYKKESSLTLPTWVGKSVGHDSEDTIDTVAFSPDGKYLASGSWDDKIRIRQTSDYKKVATLVGHTGSVRSVVFSPVVACNGQQQHHLLASASDDGTVRLWTERPQLYGCDKTAWTCTSVLNEHSDWVRSLVFSPNGEWLVSGSDDNTICLWSVKSELCQCKRDVGGSVYSLAISPNGRTLAVSTSKGMVHLIQFPLPFF